MDIRWVVGRNLARLRRERGLTQEHLQELSEVTQQYISGMEQGRRNPTIETLATLAQALGVRPMELLREETGISSPKRGVSGKSEKQSPGDRTR